ncbi:MAG: AbrB/MazE/SpoVT family DNA-binding domain-containing protein [Caldilinea sp. CFX5]|nr:AbrB/MazE/SpoVT family DNA-binding domain-containing protein [Caldilinea sp. CFX5]
MQVVTLSAKFQVVIPHKVRQTFDLQPGQKLQVVAYNHRIELIPIRAMSEARSFLVGIDTTIQREPDR